MVYKNEPSRQSERRLFQLTCLLLKIKFLNQDAGKHCEKRRKCSRPPTFFPNQRQSQLPHFKLRSANAFNCDMPLFSVEW